MLLIFLLRLSPALAQNCTNNLIREEGGNISLTSVISETPPSFLITFQMNKLYIVNINQTVSVLSDDPNNRTQLVFRDKKATLTVTDLSTDDEGVYQFFDTDCYSLTISRVTPTVPLENIKISRTTNESMWTADLKHEEVTWAVILGTALLVISVVLCIFIAYVFRRYGLLEKEEEIIYATLDLPTPIDDQIRGRSSGSEVVYSLIDFNRTAPPLPAEMLLDSDDEE